MKVILKDFVKGFGEKNDIVEVKNGFGRNYLIPQGLATIATPSAIKMAEENVRQAAHKQRCSGTCRKVDRNESYCSNKSRFQWQNIWFSNCYAISSKSCRQRV